MTRTYKDELLASIGDKIDQIHEIALSFKAMAEASDELLGDVRHTAARERLGERK